MNKSPKPIVRSLVDETIAHERQQQAGLPVPLWTVETMTGRLHRLYQKLDQIIELEEDCKLYIIIHIPSGVEVLIM